MVFKMILTISTLMIVQKSLNSFVSDENLWYASHYTQMLQSAAALCFLTAVIPYRRLFLKTVAGFWATMLVTDCLVYPLWFVHSELADWPHAVQFILTVIMFFYISIKSYDRIESDPIVTGYIYQVRAVPQGLQDLLLSVVYLRPFGGTGVICNGYWYHYRHGRLTRDSVTSIPRHKCVILKARKENSGDRESLDSRIGEKWTWVNNCATRLHPLTLEWWTRF